MQYVLSLDASIEPAQAVVVKFAGRNAEVIESHLVDLDGIFSKDYLLRSAETGTNEGSVATGHSSEQLEATEQEANVFNPLAIVQTPYTSSAVILPPYDYFSLNLELPFADAKNIEKILSFELQDRVPFDIDSFLLDYKSLGALNGKGFDIHVGLLPKQIMKAALGSCSKIGLEPVVMTAPQSALEACFYFAPDYFKENSAAMLARGHEIYLLMRFNNSISVDRVLSLDSHYTGNDTQGLAGLLTQVKLNLFAAEDRYAKSLERVYLLGNFMSPRELEKIIERKVEPINIEDLVKSSRSDFSLATLAATFAYDDYAAPVFTNFRVAEFSYRPKVKELLRILKQASSYLLATFLAFVLMIAVVLVIQQWEIRTLKNTLRGHIKDVIPKIEFEDGREINQVAEAIKDLSQELKALGSPIEYSLMEVLYEVVSSFPANADTMLNDVIIDTTNPKQNKVTIKGRAPDNTALDKIEAVYKKKKNMFKRVDGFDSKSTSSGYSFPGRDGSTIGKEFEGQLFLDDK